MSVRMRLKRFGKKKKPIYRIVIADQKNPRDGKTIEDIGQYNPAQSPVVVTVKEERVKYWLSVGAQASDTVKRLLTGIGLMEEKAKQSSNQKVAKKDRKKSSLDES
jgi:small subunit ribosomal protein S16